MAAVGRASVLLAQPAVPSEPPVAQSKEPPLAGWYAGTFFLRDETDSFRLYIQGRAHVDAYVPFGPGVSDSAPGSGLKSTVFLRRIRPEISGEFLHQWQFKIEGDWGQTTNDNANGQAASQNCRVDPATREQSCSTRASAIQVPVQRPSALDVYINWALTPFFNLQAGQFKAPFSYENRTSENFTPFMEASTPVRAVAVPFNREIGVMTWGEVRDGLLYYSLGVFNGDGPNRMNPDNKADVIGRVFVHPLHELNTPLKDLQVGVSAHYGMRDPHYVGYDYPAMTTQGGFAFWRPTYSDSNGNLVHVLPSGDQRALGAELFVPVNFIDLTGELFYIHNDTREALDGYQLSGFTERRGEIKGYAYYAQVGVWPIGDRSIIGRRGYSLPPHVDFKKPPPKHFAHGLELLAKFEQVRLTYDGASRFGGPDTLTPDGDIRMNAYALGVNYYFTRHLRLSTNYTLYDFPDSAPVSASSAGARKQSSDQRAVAPAQLLTKGVNDDARTNGHLLHELMFRVGVAL